MKIGKAYRRAMASQATRPAMSEAGSSRRRQAGGRWAEGSKGEGEWSVAIKNANPAQKTGGAGESTAAEGGQQPESLGNRLHGSGPDQKPRWRVTARPKQAKTAPANGARA